MKATERSDNKHFLRDRIDSFFGRPSSYIYFGLAAIAFGLYWKEKGLVDALRMLVLMTNGFVTTFILTQVMTLFLYKEFKRNLFITNCIVVMVLSVVILYYFNSEVLYWSFIAGAFFMLPIIIGVIVSKIKSS